MTITELSNLVDIRHIAFRKLEQSGLIIVVKFITAKLEERKYLIKDPAKDTYMLISYKDGQFVACSDAWKGIDLTYSRLLAITYFVDYLNTLLRLTKEGEIDG